MLTQLYDWIMDITSYLIVVSAVLQVIPGKEYKKYIQFFSGLVLILLLCTPILKLSGMQDTFTAIYSSREYEMEKQEIERRAQYFEDLDILKFVPEQYKERMEESGGQIEVEEIKVGK
ncbi:MULTISPECIES: stage III sporulation protein AF [Lachnospiraceae]|jgi:stage III sporulation protein AF|uniref:Stage III sporulation protein AF n=1 Tax=Faecalicatena acetigenes TaxID=2981790 RepID=A0ABT2TD02_9FIRM|nr:MULTISPECIES: stage III sporulation protein AF [Lachnospiraceae]MCU6748163.1 stage III sporulation protein AF [Faecalicatena acetigenes]RGT74408.1 stage III sporulation protein AF [Ruminococcus sp. AF18-22]SCI29491.1 stage III sporulation protein AF [uncultured Clostridium sp.]